MKVYNVSNDSTTTHTEHPSKDAKHLPAEQTSYQQWVVWHYGEMRSNNRFEKVPKDPITGKCARTNDPGTWGTYSEATSALLERCGFDGVGFMLSYADPYTVIDLDNCRDSETGEVEAWALEIVRRFDSLTFVSPSGTGLHIWVKGTLLHLLPKGKGGFKKENIEGYSAKHFMTFTGDVYSGEIIEERQTELEELYEELHPEPKLRPEIASIPSGGGMEDHEVVELCSRSYGDEFDGPYYRGDISRWKTQSEADYALMRKFAWATRHDHEQMRRLFSESSLSERAKFWGRPDYQQRTIETAIRNTPDVYDPAHGDRNSTGQTLVRKKIEESYLAAILRGQVLKFL